MISRQSLSEVKMGRGSPICERVHKKIVEYFENNVPQRKIAKALQISSSTGHNIIKRFVVFGPSDDTASLIGMILSTAWKEVYLY